jgi:uncharacterized protein YqjF (DUF2071 family)
MNVNEILKTINHRPWELPKEKWKYYQEWNNAIFLHWQVDYDELRKLVPKDLDIDLFEGKAYISIVAFTMQKIRPRNIPSFSPISDFHEINIRTYVKVNKKSGVHFLSIEGAKKLSCRIAKKISGLPYRYSKMKRTNNYYTSHNQKHGDYLSLSYQIGGAINNISNIDKWLTERYALFQNVKQNVIEYEIHHIEWPIFHIRLENLNVNYGRFNRLITNEPNYSYYSTGVQVIAWEKKKII